MQTNRGLTSSTCFCQYCSPYKDISSITSKHASEMETIKISRRTSEQKCGNSIKSGVHALFLLLIRINRYEHFPVFHNQ